MTRGGTRGPRSAAVMLNSFSFARAMVARALPNRREPRPSLQLTPDSLHGTIALPVWATNDGAPDA